MDVNDKLRDAYRELKKRNDEIDELTNEKLKMSEKLAKLETENEALKAELTTLKPKNEDISDSNVKKMRDVIPKNPPYDKKMTITIPNPPKSTTDSEIGEVDFMVDLNNVAIYNQASYRNRQYPDGRLNPRFERVQSAYNYINQKSPDNSNPKPQSSFPIAWFRMLANSKRFWDKTVGGEEAEISMKCLLHLLVLQLNRFSTFDDNEQNIAEKRVYRTYADLTRFMEPKLKPKKPNEVSAEKSKKDPADQPTKRARSDSAATKKSDKSVENDERTNERNDSEMSEAPKSTSEGE